MFQPGDEKIFHLNQRKGNYPRLFPSSGLTITIVPIIVVFTKVDLILPKNQVSAESYFKERCGQAFEMSTGGQVPYTVVSSMLWPHVSRSTLTSPSSLTTCNFDASSRYDAQKGTC